MQNPNERLGEPSGGSAAGARAFLSGLTGSSWTSLFGAALFALLELATCCLYLTPRRFANLDAHWLMETSGDEYARLSVKILRWHFRKPAPLEVTYVGASWATRALAERDEGALSAELSALTGQNVRFNLFTANNQRYEDALLIAEQLPHGYRGLFTLMVTDYKDDYRGKDIAERRRKIAALPAPALEGMWAREGYRPRRTGVFFLDHLEFFAARRIAALRLGAAHSSGAGAPAAPDAERFEKMAKAAAVDRSKSAKKIPLLSSSFKVLDKLMQKLQERGVLFVLLDAPDNPFREEAVSERLASYREDAAFFAAERHADFWSFQDDLDLEPSDFQDREHVGSSRARARYEQRLLERLADVIDVSFPKEQR